MKKWVLSLALLLAAAIVFTGCGQKEESAPPEAQGGETKEFTINAKNFDFDLKEIRVKKGDMVKVTLKNTEGVHAMKFDGYDQEVQGDQTISFVADKTGEFKYICSIFCGEGHANMTGKLIVE